MFTDSADLFMDTVDRHAYTNDCYKKLEEVNKANIVHEIIEPDETLNYVIEKYKISLERA